MFKMYLKLVEEADLEPDILYHWLGNVLFRLAR